MTHRTDAEARASSWRHRLLAAALLSTTLPIAVQAAALDPASAERFAGLALACVHQQYPNHVSHTLNGDGDVQSPHALTPAFYGCLDWHSSVHGHWLLARLARLHPDAPYAAPARAALETSLTPAHIATEVAYLEGKGRASFERPYGYAWMLQLSAELHAWNDPDARRWARNVEPLERAVVARIERWLPNLYYPVRIGEHSQTAFSLGLMLDWAAARRDTTLRDLVLAKARAFYEGDRHCPLDYEPSGEDFLSPCLGEADLMRRVLDRAAYARWLSVFLPQVGRGTWLEPAVVTERSDPKLAHLDGLNLSRAWMLQGIASGLPASDRRVAILRRTADAHAAAALPQVTGEYYEGGHWLGTFATYLMTAGGGSDPQP